MPNVTEFCVDETGAVTIEFVTIFPAFVMVLLFFTDTAVLFLTRTELLNLSQDALRRVAVGALHVNDVPAYVSQRSLLGARTYTAASYSGNIAIIEMSVNVGDASVFGFFTPILGRTMAVRVEMLREPTPPPASVAST